LAKLNAWIDDPAVPIIDRVYGGDLLGNVWRIDVDGKEAFRIAQLKDGANKPQPITTKPELAMVTASGSEFPVVLVGTGKYLGVSDVGDISQQSIYALKDSLGQNGIGDVRGDTMIKRVLTQTSGSNSGSLAGRTIRTISGGAINWGSHNGWYVDFNPSNTSPGERVNVDMSLQFNTLTVAANVPADNVCEMGGYAFLYFLDINSGLNLTTATDGMAGVKLSGNALVAGIKTVSLTTGQTITIVTESTGNVGSEDNPSATGSGSGAVRRTTWREIPD
jgi:type IV pilus assembly protein PilY1